MNRWLLKNKDDFASWKNAADHIGKSPIKLNEVGTPAVYPVIICWHWYTATSLTRYDLAYTFVAPHDFEYCVP